jgi:hypothetical protein
MRYEAARAILSEAIEQLDEYKYMQPVDPVYPFDPARDKFNPKKHMHDVWMPVPPTGVDPGLPRVPPIDIGKPPPPMMTPQERAEERRQEGMRRYRGERILRDRLRKFGDTVRDALRR